MLLELLQQLSNGLYMFFALTLSVDKNVIEVYYHKNVKLLFQDLVNIALECSRCIVQSKRHYLVLEIAVTGPESFFLFIAFLDLHMMIEIDQVELSKT